MKLMATTGVITYNINADPLGIGFLILTVLLAIAWLWGYQTGKNSK